MTALLVPSHMTFGNAPRIQPPKRPAEHHPRRAVNGMRSYPAIPLHWNAGNPSRETGGMLNCAGRKLPGRLSSQPFGWWRRSVESGRKGPFSRCRSLDPG